MTIDASIVAGHKLSRLLLPGSDLSYIQPNAGFHCVEMKQDRAIVVAVHWGLLSGVPVGLPSLGVREYRGRWVHS